MKLAFPLSGGYNNLQKHVSIFRCDGKVKLESHVSHWWTRVLGETHLIWLADIGDILLLWSCQCKCRWKWIVWWLIPAGFVIWHQQNNNGQLLRVFPLLGDRIENTLHKYLPLLNPRQWKKKRIFFFLFFCVFFFLLTMNKSVLHAAYLYSNYDNSKHAHSFLHVPLWILNPRSLLKQDFIRNGWIVRCFCVTRDGEIQI